MPPCSQRATRRAPAWTDPRSPVGRSGASGDTRQGTPARNATWEIYDAYLRYEHPRYDQADGHGASTALRRVP